VELQYIGLLFSTTTCFGSCKQPKHVVVQNKRNSVESTDLTKSLSHWCCSLVPALTTTMTLFFSFSWGFLTRVVLRCAGGASLPPNHKLVDKASVFMSSGDRVIELHPWILEIHFIHLLRYAWTTLGYSCSRPLSGNKQIIVLLNIL
jgi:hypothetical protein